MNCSKSTIIKVSLSVVGLLLIPLVMIRRGYFAIGGEIFLPVFPFLLWELANVINEIIEVLKGGEEY